MNVHRSKQQWLGQNSSLMVMTVARARFLRLKNDAGNSLEHNRLYCGVIYSQGNRVQGDRRPHNLHRLFAVNRLVAIVFYSITWVQMIDRRNGQRMW